MLEDGTVYQTYSTTGRGVEFLMTYYGVLDRTAHGRDEAEGFQLWIQRRDEYDSEQRAAASLASGLMSRLLRAADDSVAFEAAYLDGRHPEQIREYGFGVLAKLRCAPDRGPGDR